MPQNCRAQLSGTTMRLFAAPVRAAGSGKELRPLSKRRLSPAARQSTRWNVAGAFVYPKGMTINWYNSPPDITRPSLHND